MLHRNLGLVVGAWFVLLGLTGSLLVYQDEIDRWLNPALLVSAGRSALLAPHEIVERAQAQFPGSALERLRIPQQPDEVYRLLIREQGHRRIGSTRIEAAFDPYDGTYLGRRVSGAYGMSPALLMQTIYDLHHKVLLGNRGKTAVGMVGLTLLSSVLCGVILAMANARRLGVRGLLGIRTTAHAVRMTYDAHRATGLVMAMLLVLSTTTGFALVFPDYAREIIGWVSKVAPFPTVPFVQLREPAQSANLAQHVALIRGRYPQARMTEIHLPLRPSSGYLFYLRQSNDVHRLGDTLVWVDPRTGSVLLERSSQRRSAGEQFLHWLMPLHSGVAFGPVGRALMCFAGITPAALFLTGLFVWWRKRRANAFERRRREMPHRNISGSQHGQ